MFLTTWKLIYREFKLTSNAINKISTKHVIFSVAKEAIYSEVMAGIVNKSIIVILIKQKTQTN